MTRQRPPGPSSRLWSTYLFVTRPLTTFSRWFEQYGDPFHLPAVNGNVVLTAQPRLIKKIFSTPPSAYGPFAAKGIAAVTGPRSVFQLRDKPHRRHRRLIMPSFHGSRMRAYAADMQHTTRHVFDRAVGRGPVPLHTLTQQISLEVILRTVFGVQQPARVARFAEAVTEVIDATLPSFIFMPFLQRELWGMGPFARFRRRFERLDALLVDQIARTRREGPGEDVLSMLLTARDEHGGQLDDQEIRDELRTLLFAGHETTGIALSWAMDAIGRHPKVAERLIDELTALGPDPDPAALAKVPYLEAVCNETLRKYPIITEVLRTLHEPMELGGYELAPPTAVAASIMGVHLREDLYPEPRAFRPERFLERKFGPHEFLPFGGGHRRCIGAAFAGFEMQVVLGTVLREYAVALQNPTAPRPVRRTVTMAPHDGVPAVITRDRPGSMIAAA